MNVIVAAIVAIRFRKEIRNYTGFRITAITCVILLISGFIFSDKLTSFAESFSYPDRIVYTKTSPYQRIVLTKNQNDWRLFLNGNLQFSSADEYRYHEALVHPGMSQLHHPKHILIFGGGDGMAAREVLKYSSVETITLVDLDKAITDLFKSHVALLDLNQRSLLSSKVHIVNEDAFVWIRNQQNQFDFIIIDFPDPSNYSLGKLYTTSFYREVTRNLSQQGAIVVQSTSPFVARQSFGIIAATLNKVGFSTFPYHCYVPSFGEWGFVLASKTDLRKSETLPSGLKFLTQDYVHQLFVFPPDMSPLEGEANTLNNQVLVNTFIKEWATYPR
jgi:spermidine synthase